MTLSQQVRTVGYLEYDQQRMVTVTPKYSGWVERVYVNYVGEQVRRGQPLFEVYSPELVQTAQELISALEFAAEMADAPDDARQRAQSLVESARVRLRYWDITDEQITRLEETGEVFRTLTVTAPAGGLVMKRMAGLEGMAVSPGMELFHIANLSSLWLSVELYEDQLACRPGGHGGRRSRCSYFPGETFRGSGALPRARALRAHPHDARQDRDTRTSAAGCARGCTRRSSSQPVAVPDAVAVPSAAVLRTGERSVVIVALGEGRFEPRDVRTGHEAEGYVELLGRGGGGYRGGDLRPVPHRLGVEAPRGGPEDGRRASEAEGFGRRADHRIAMLIEWCLRNQLFVMVALALAILAGVWAIRETRIDAIPDLSDVQVIVYTEFPGQAPQVVEDQVTYPITTKMLAVPFAKVVRGYSFFGFSFVYVIFEDGTDLYWARSRVLEYLSGLSDSLPEGAAPQLGPGRDRRRLGLHLRPQLAAAVAGRAAQPAGLVPAVRPLLRSTEWRRSRRSAASCASTRSRSTRFGCAPTTCRWRR